MSATRKLGVPPDMQSGLGVASAWVRRLARHHHATKRCCGIGGLMAVFCLTGALSCQRATSPSQARPAEDREGAKRFYVQAQALRQQGAYDEALAACDQAVKLAPSRVPPYLLRAEILAEVNRYREAERDLRTALRLAPDEISVLLQFLRLVPPYASPQEKEAVARRAVARAPDNGEAHYYLGLALVNYPDATRWQEAESALRRSSQLAPWMALPLLELGKLYIRQRRFAAAQNALEQAWDNLAAPRSPLRAAMTPSELRGQQRSVAFWLHQVYRRRRDPRAAAIGQVLEKLRRRTEVEEQLQERAHAIPPDPEAQLQLAQMALQDGDARTAARYARAVLNQRPHDAQAQKILQAATGEKVKR
ncbi:MAG: tetratricopeptide repeat protein [Abditibacteriales bacterium]|nr:tetratricopeptide repeat protein [Abditibacteriales bacterium]